MRALLVGKPLGAFGGAVLLAMLVLAAAADRVAPYAYDDADVFQRLKPSSGEHWLGTDNLGRDLLSRVIHGARVSMAVGFGGVALGLALATAVGLASGYAGGRLDLVLQRLVDAFMCFPCCWSPSPSWPCSGPAWATWSSPSGSSSASATRGWSGAPCWA